jgi:transcription-repair coupling factor (superfamily II helicase)
MTIETMARKLENLVPHARIVVGHGQMHADDLERVMTQFVNGEADILLSTTIIESGLDIPNANTIIIDRADRFGLSDLYQLRGRVGRYKHQAYAYLLIPRHAGLLTEARKRISAIRQYATLGSGFKIAMRDLEIRGAGNLLGAEQSGHITAVGFELYCQLLKQSVSTLKGEKVKPRINVEVNLDFMPVGMNSPSATTDSDSHVNSASLPYSYIADSRQRITFYRKLAECDDRATVKALEAELADRFGEPPQSVKHLLTVTDLKVVAAGRNITRIESDEDRLMLTRDGDFIQVGGKFPRLAGKSPSARLKEIRRLLMAL